MAFKCDACGKGPRTGMNVSHAHNRNKRTFRPNLQKVHGVLNGKKGTFKVCTRCLRSGKVAKVISSAQAVAPQA